MVRRRGCRFAVKNIRQINSFRACPGSKGTGQALAKRESEGEPTMSRISVRTRDDLPEALRPLWDRMKSYGDFENQAGVMAHRAPIFRNMWTLLTELSDEAVLSKRYLELCLVTVSLINKCDYCVSHHT